MVGASPGDCRDLGGRHGILKEVMAELSLEREVGIHHVGERNRWACQVGGMAWSKAERHWVL